MELNPYQIIIRPLVTEKGTRMVETGNAYCFQVHRDANKQQIREAVEKIYSVKVEAVRTQNRRGKPRRAKNRYTTTSDWKKAVVKLKPDFNIDVF
jgi:large subunit ribosomal protein L23